MCDIKDCGAYINTLTTKMVRCGICILLAIGLFRATNVVIIRMCAIATIVSIRYLNRGLMKVRQ